MRCELEIKCLNKLEHCRKEGVKSKLRSGNSLTQISMRKNEGYCICKFHIDYNSQKELSKIVFDLLPETVYVDIKKNEQIPDYVGQARR